MVIYLVGYSTLLEASELMAEYAAECSIPEIGKTAPNPETYAAMEKSGALKCFGAYLQGRLVGFATVLTSVLPHYSRKVAIVESIFAEKDSGAGLKLLRVLDAHAKAEDCGVILYSAPFGGRFEQLLSRQKECRQTNSVFCKSLS